MDHNDIKRYLIVSLGSIGRRHLKNLRSIRPNAKIAVLRLHARPTGEDLPEGADMLFHYVDEALEFAPTAAIIASPASTHLSVALPLARAGVALLIEKPIADQCSGLRELILTAENSGAVLMIAYNLRFLPSLRETRRLILDGVIGNVLGVRAEVGQYLPAWRPDTPYQQSASAQRALGGGALLELSHEIDYLYWMFGMPERVTATGGRYSELEIDVEDMASLCLEYERPKRMVHVHLDFLQQATTRSCKFIGSKGTLIWDGLQDRVDIFYSGHGEWERLEVPPCPDRNVMYIDEVSDFLDCVDSGRVPAITAKEAYDVLAIVEAAKASINTKSSVVVEAYNGR